MKIQRFAVFATALLLSFSLSAQFKLETFGNFKKMGAQPDQPIDFKTSFQPKTQVYILFSFPDKPSEFEAWCYWLTDGQEKMRGTASIKCFGTSGKTTKQYKSVGMMYDEGEYKIVITDASKNIVAETRFTVAGAAAASSVLPKATITICDDTDNNLKPIKPIVNGTINKGDGVNFQAKLDKAIGARFFIWSIYSVNEAGEEIPWKDWQVDVADEKYTMFATDSKTYFTNPGKYVIYMLPQNATNTGTTIGGHTRYYGKAALEVK